ncbi:MAG: recombinase family protein [Candidatus Atribacteria bacterium]|nr:recombinase family protein [Candidatus Atribacteria bacterium]
MKKAAIYIRINRIEEKNHCSYAVQEKETKKYLTKRHLGLAELYADIIPGMKDNKRPALQKLLKDAKAKKFDFVVVYRLERISNNIKTLHAFLQELKKSGIELKSVEENSSHEKLLIQLLNLFDEYKRLLSNAIKQGEGYSKSKPYNLKTA